MYEVFAQLLKQKGVTAYRVSVETGVSQGSLSDWKNGKSRPKYESIKKIADYFDVSVDYLLNGPDNKKSPAETAEDDEVPEDFILLARKADEIPPQKRKQLYKFLNSTIDTFLEAIKDENGSKPE